MLLKVSEFWLYVINIDYYRQLAELSIEIDTALRNLLATHAGNPFLSGLLTDFIDANGNLRMDLLTLSGDASQQALHAYLELYDQYTNAFLNSLSLDVDMFDFLNKFDLYLFPKNETLEQYDLFEYFEEFLRNRKELTEI